MLTNTNVRTLAFLPAGCAASQSQPEGADNDGVSYI